MIELIALLLAAPSSNFAPQKLNHACSGNFCVIQLATDDLDRLDREWAVPTVGVELTNVGKAIRNKPIHNFIVFQGCRPDEGGSCKLRAEFEIIGPGEAQYGDRQSAEAWNGPVPATENLQISPAMLTLVVEPQDKLGPYRVRIRTIDEIAGLIVTTENVLTAIEAEGELNPK